jgi:LuxR family glucitol operon transcriptional activator
MASTAPKHFHIFLSSPIDVSEERKFALEILGNIPLDPPFRDRLTIAPVAWDMKGVPFLANMTPQEAISEGLRKPSECNIVIVILWSRIGTPLSSQYVKENGERYLSGTEWEYEDAIKASDAHKSPVVLIYRRTEKVLLDADDPQFESKQQQYKSVKILFESLNHPDGSVKRGYNQYETPAEFRHKLEHDLRFTLDRLLNNEKLSNHVHNIPVVALVSKQPTQNLPPRTYGELLGRKADIDRVMKRLESRYPLIAIEGFAGTGKTSLAIEMGYICHHDINKSTHPPLSFEYVAWISAKDKPDQERWLNEVLNTISYVTNFLKIAQLAPERIEEKKFLIDRLLRNHCILIIVDNFESINDDDLFQWIVEVPEPSKVIVTTRIRQLQQAWPISLEGLDESEAIKLIRKEADKQSLDNIYSMNDEDLKPLVVVTGGNPAAIELALGTMNGGTLCFSDVISNLHERGGQDMRLMFDALYSSSWSQLSRAAQQTLLVIPPFTGDSSVSKKALQAVSGLSSLYFDSAVKQLVKFKLVSVNHKTQRYSVLPMTRTFAMSQLDNDPEFEKGARTRWSNYFLEFVRENAKRTTPEEIYWNSLVNKNMEAIDEEWVSVHEVLEWAEQNGKEELFIELVTLLLHSMYGRLLNVERQKFVQRAATIAGKNNMKEIEALLRIDALGWTFVEANCLDEAMTQINAGMNIVQEIFGDRHNDVDLYALGLAWQARVMIEKQQPLAAEEKIEQALAISCRPVIQYRVNLAAGDVSLKRGNNERALHFYQAALAVSEKYGGEGQGYQTDPGIGLAYLGIGECDKAEVRFRALQANDNIPIGRLYGDYGMSLVAYERGNKDAARRLARAAKEELSRRTTSSFLLKLMDKRLEEFEQLNSEP